VSTALLHAQTKTHAYTRTHARARTHTHTLLISIKLRYKKTIIFNLVG